MNPFSDEPNPYVTDSQNMRGTRIKLSDPRYMAKGKGAKGGFKGHRSAGQQSGGNGITKRMPTERYIRSLVQSHPEQAAKLYRAYLAGQDMSRTTPVGESYVATGCIATDHSDINREDHSDRERFSYALNTATPYVPKETDE